MVSAFAGTVGMLMALWEVSVFFWEMDNNLLFVYNHSSVC
jgi:hypothetical protein